ncbi:5-formyltetrahydrofolate cyclo-ligase, partial [Candidatus Sumerlaeota bacterium]|nr:5-formyltetrahydrofolate cyclo-ligase [Candidatus Sumerlaeota bacterium]
MLGPPLAAPRALLMTPAFDAKRRLRSELRGRRRAMSPEERERLSAEIARHVLALPPWTEASSVMLYLAVPGEVETDALAGAALAQGKRLCVPRVTETDEIEAVAIRSLEDVERTPRGLREPPPGHGEVVDPAGIVLLLIPCVAVDPQGHRLGQGGGHFDRFLAR